MIFTLLQNDLLHRVCFQVFAKVFCIHSVGHLVVASTLLNSNCIKHFVGSGFFKSIKVFQVICGNYYRSFENAECDVNDVVLVFYCSFRTYFRHFSGFSIVDFEQVNVSWVVLFQGCVVKTYQQYFFQVNERGHTFSSFEKRFVSGLIMAVQSPMQQNHLELSFLLSKTNSHIKVF